jgi:hypothetical protein
MGNQADGDFLDWRHSHQMKAERNLPSHPIDRTALCRTLIRDRNANELSQVVHNGHELTDDEPDRMVPSSMPITSLPQVAKDGRSVGTTYPREALVETAIRHLNGRPP